MKHVEIENVRHTRGASLLLFLTDRCPVGCAHCSVDSRADSPMISDFELFEKLLKGICEKPGIQVVGISGGEPFAERRGLSRACQMLSEHGKSIVIYTSGVWAKNQRPPLWIASVLKSCDTVYLSTDSFHQAGVPALHFVQAARQIAHAGAWIVVQTLEIDYTTVLLEQAFGENFSDHAEINPISPLSNGRGTDVFTLNMSHKASAMGTCSLAVTPVVRYDGVVTSCCNEEIIMGKGPDRFRCKVSDSDDLYSTLDRFDTDPLMRCVADVGLGHLTMHPQLDGLKKQRYASNCELCWKVMDEFPSVPETDRLIYAIAQLGESV